MKKHFIELAMAVLMLVCFYILSWEAAETTGRLIDVSGNIKADQVILVDAGHGGMDSGMVGIGGLKEKGINLDIAMKLKGILEKKGLAVVMTREEDKGLYENGTKNMKAQDLQNRIEQIRKYEPVLSVSIHQNSYSDPGKHEPEAFHCTASGGKRKQDLLSSEAKSRCDQYRRMWISYKSGGSCPASDREVSVQGSRGCGRWNRYISGKTEGKRKKLKKM